MTTTPLWTVFVTAGAALVGVIAGAFFQSYRDKRAWQREHAQHWIDTRLDIYKEFVVAHREYLAYVMLESTKINATDHPRYAERMPIFDAEGVAVRQRHEAAFTALRLVAASQDTEAAMVGLVTGARRIACSRADTSPDDVPRDLFADNSRFEQGFINAARSELGLPSIERVFGSQAVGPAVSTQDALGSGDA